jgi:hypothetical protein
MSARVRVVVDRIGVNTAIVAAAAIAGLELAAGCGARRAGCVIKRCQRLIRRVGRIHAPTQTACGLQMGVVPRLVVGKAAVGTALETGGAMAMVSICTRVKVGSHAIRAADEDTSMLAVGFGEIIVA